MEKSNNVYVGVSGGPDSMFLLYFLSKKYNDKKINVLHVNYNFRKESIEEEEMIKNYCRDNRINFYVLNVDKNLIEKYNIKNKQNLARKIRYDFFLEKTKNEKNPKIFLGHNKDDFIETAIMLKKKSNDYFFYGIKKKSNYKNLIIIRPLINYWKKEIINLCQKNKIPYKIDKSNFSDIYERNKIRKELLNLTLKEKEEIFSKYNEENKKNIKKNNEIKKIYEEWKKTKYDIFFYKSINLNYKSNIIYLYLLKQNFDLKVNKNKVISICNFLEKSNFYKKNFRIKENIFLSIEKNKVKIKKI